MDKYKAPALAKGLDIIDLIRAHGPLSFNALQDHTGDNPASLSRYLHTLLAKDYIHKSDHQKYTLGHKLKDLTNQQSLWPVLTQYLAPYMTTLSTKYQVTLLLLAYTNNQFTVIEKALAEDNLGMMPKGTLGEIKASSLWSSHFYSHTSAIDDYIKTQDMTTVAFDLRQLLIHIKTYDYLEHISGKKQIIRLGFPIRFNNRVIATLCLGSFIPQLPEDNKKEIIAQIKAMISEVEKILD